MSSRTITSLGNDTVKRVRALHMRKERDGTGLFVAEGLKNVIEGIDTGHAPKILMHGPDATDHPMMQKAVQAWEEVHLGDGATDKVIQASVERVIGSTWSRTVEAEKAENRRLAPVSPEGAERRERGLL